MMFLIFFDGLDEGVQHLYRVALDAEVRDAEDGGLGVLVDGDDRLRARHSSDVLYGPRYPEGEVEPRGDRFA